MSNLTDVFAPDAFDVYSLTSAIQKIPPQELGITSTGLFNEVPVAGTLISVEENNGTLALIPTSSRGGPGTSGADSNRVVRNFRLIHYQVDDNVMADDVLNVRAFGSNDQTAGVAEVVARKLGIARASLDSSIEYGRSGCVQGSIVYPAGSIDPTLNVFTAFGTTAPADIDFAFTTATTNIVEQIIPQISDAMEVALGSLSYNGVLVFCGRTFFRTLISHAQVKEIYRDQQTLIPTAGSPVAFASPNRRQVTIGNVTFMEYYSVLSGVTSINASEAHCVPLGTDLFKTFFGPADLIESVGTMGQKLYARQYAAQDGKSVTLESQTNPLSLCLRPRCLQKLTMS
jgi:hypothetical protein